MRNTPWGQDRAGWREASSWGEAYVEGHGLSQELGVRGASVPWQSGGGVSAWGRALCLGAWPPRGAGLVRAGRRVSLTVFVSESGVDEGGSRVEEDAEVEGGHVVGLDAVVLDGHVAVVVWPGVHIPAAVRGVQHVREARLLQPVAVQRCGPGAGRRGSRWTPCASGGARLSSQGPGPSQCKAITSKDPKRLSS